MARDRRSRARTPASRPRARAVAPAPVAPLGPLVLGAIPGATPGRWVETWRERTPSAPLDLRWITVSAQRAALDAGDVDAAIVRLPIERAGLHVIPLYEEVAVVVASAESHLLAADELDVADLAGETLIVPADDVLGIEVPGVLPPAFDPPATTEDAVALVAAGVGVTVVPMSLARLHHRRDVDHRPLRGGPASAVALAWVADRTTPEVEAFVGIVRGRTANSSRR